MGCIHNWGCRVCHSSLASQIFVVIMKQLSSQLVAVPLVAWCLTEPCPVSPDFGCWNSELNDYCNHFLQCRGHAQSFIGYFEEHPNEELRSIARTLQPLKNKDKEMNEKKRMGMEELEEVNFLICFRVIIEINKYVVELENFRNEMSNREKIDFKNYTLLKFLYQIIAEKNLRVEFICDVLEETSAFNVKIEAVKKDLIDNASTMSDISILWNNLLNLCWKNFVIEGCYRKWTKTLVILIIRRNLCC
ncbi:hypothetical protein RhiirC2_705364 [Rhizophagus irregularis]|uniref:Uncharacterized protein n=1 Tax=Rhizophagus irregularis TaxID=588596 RepID=A0A2N1NYP9_9GLOM|nr:hypothetical protein RhiirC2_705364 [Rhizophagus irregularis]